MWSLRVSVSVVATDDCDSAISCIDSDSTDKYSEALGVVAEKDLIFINVVCLLISYS